MDMEKFTERSRGFLQAAQTIAIREENQRVVPEHLLKALMDDDQGLAANLITRAGGDAQAVRRAVDEAVARLPKVSGGDGQVYVDSSLVRVMDEAQKIAKQAGDSFVPVERVLMALAMVSALFRGPAAVTRGLLLAGGALMAWGTYLGGFHSGVEWGWWPGPTDCAAAVPPPAGSGTGGVLDQIDAYRPPSCDEAAGRFLGLSFAGWNVVATQSVH